ncbi:hypothetical protein B0H16DRAFT_1719553 [Mycena metata]|uniref:Uncharacterized protein n=1 Tax=Mycena metata TaxID=1033252 RepID=A0AAD7NII0_9AGAR|nr:hypothetical protein B0H16DRAFT_1719553 [Mycena metata]
MSTDHVSLQYLFSISVDAPIFFSVDTSFRVTRLGGGGGSLTSSDIVVDDDDELPDLIDLDDCTPVVCFRHIRQRQARAKL